MNEVRLAPFSPSKGMQLTSRYCTVNGMQETNVETDVRAVGYHKRCLLPLDRLGGTDP